MIENIIHLLKGVTLIEIGPTKLFLDQIYKRIGDSEW